MDHNRNSQALVRLSGVLAACGLLILGAAVFLLTTALWHSTRVSSGVQAHMLVPPALAACVATASIVALVASAFVRHIANHRSASLAKRLALMAVIGTAAGWLAAGVAV